MSAPLLLPLLAVVVVLGFRMLGGSRLVPLIQSAALQGVLLAALGPLLAHGEASWVGLAAALGTASIKGLALPALLLRATREVEISREVEPLVGYNISLASGALALCGAVWVAARVPLGSDELARVAAVGIFTLFTGLFLLVSRRKAITQAIGYLTFENGIYALGHAVAREQPLLIELGVLLDLCVAVFVMGIIVFHIQREFAHVDVDRLAELHDFHSAAPLLEAPASASEERAP